MSMKHGMSKTPEWKAWERMRSRCYNPNDQRHARYGARGITVCERWRGSFLAFYEDMGRRPSPRHTLERRDNDGNYEPVNCFWATKKEQARNRSTNFLLTIGAETKPLSVWCEQYGKPHALVWQRIRNMGWPAVEALTHPIVPKSVGVRGRRALKGEAA